MVKWDAHSHPKTERITRIRLRIFRMARALCICKILPLEIKHKPLSFSLPFELRKYFECGPFKLVRFGPLSKYSNIHWSNTYLKTRVLKAFDFRKVFRSQSRKQFPALFRPKLPVETEASIFMVVAE